MPYSPLDVLIDALPAVRKAGRVMKGDTVWSVHSRIAAVYLPIVKRIREEAMKERDRQVSEIQRNATGVHGS